MPEILENCRDEIDFAQKEVLKLGCEIDADVTL